MQKCKIVFVDFIQKIRLLVLFKNNSLRKSVMYSTFLCFTYRIITFFFGTSTRYHHIFSHFFQASWLRLVLVRVLPKLKSGSFKNNIINTHYYIYYRSHKFFYYVTSTKWTVLLYYIIVVATEYKYQVQVPANYREFSLDPSHERRV